MRITLKKDKELAQVVNCGAMIYFTSKIDMGNNGSFTALVEYDCMLDHKVEDQRPLFVPIFSGMVKLIKEMSANPLVIEQAEQLIATIERTSELYDLEDVTVQ